MSDDEDERTSKDPWTWAREMCIRDRSKGMSVSALHPPEPCDDCKIFVDALTGYARAVDCPQPEPVSPLPSDDDLTAMFGSRSTIIGSMGVAVAAGLRIAAERFGHGHLACQDGDCAYCDVTGWARKIDSRGPGFTRAGGNRS